jgi:hypothetical protein
MEQKQRRCNDPDHKGKRYLPVTAFYTAGYRNGKRAYGSICKECKKRIEKYKYHAGLKVRDEERKAKYLRARSRAQTRLKNLYPEMFEKLMAEELMKE